MKIKVRLLVLLMGCSFCVLAAFVSRWLAETVFFDRFFYYKSSSHGYFTTDQSIGLAQFGQRVYGYRLLKDEIGGQCDMSSRIVLIGDSYLWGMGVRNSKTVSSQLRSLLPNMEVVVYAYPGASLQDYIGFYEFARLVSPSNFYVYFAVDNDILADSTTGYGTRLAGPVVQKCSNSFPDQRLIITPDWHTLDHVKAAQLTHTATADSWQSAVNRCIAQELLDNLTGLNGGFLLTDPYRETSGRYVQYKKLLLAAGLTVWSAQEEVIQQGIDAQKLQVSQLEIHPSQYAHRMYAEILAKKIQQTQWWYAVVGTQAQACFL